MRISFNLAVSILSLALICGPSVACAQEHENEMKVVEFEELHMVIALRSGPDGKIHNQAEACATSLISNEVTCGIIDVGDLPDGIIDVGDLPDGIIDVGDLPGGIWTEPTWNDFSNSN